MIKQVFILSLLLSASSIVAANLFIAKTLTASTVTESTITESSTTVNTVIDKNTPEVEFSSPSTQSEGSVPSRKTLSNALVSSPLTLVGSAKFSVLFWDIYQSSLYTSSGSFFGIEYLNKGDTANKVNQTQPNDNKTEQLPLLFEIEYLRDITQQDLISRTLEQWQHLNIDETDYNRFLPTLKSIWPDIKAGDSLALLVNDDSSHFYFNDDYIGTITQANFGPLFLAIWLSPDTSQPKLRKKLLGETN